MLIYNDKTQFGTSEDGTEIVYDWAREEGFFPEIRVEAFRKYVEGTWKVSWLDEEAVKARFDLEKRKHAASPRREAAASSGDFGVYVLGDSAL